jgi:Arc/MetJ-type ribon-helix-helix transcriptional regulator
MATFSLSLNRDLSDFVNSQVHEGVASNPEDYVRLLIKKQMDRVKNNTKIMEE